MSATTTTEQLTGRYTIDPDHSRIGFVARHAMIAKVRGSFNDVDGTAYLDAETPSDSHAELTIQASSIDTRNADRDAHLRSNDFFAMEEYPQLRFVTTDVAHVEGDTYRVTGDLTIRGTTNSVTLDLEFAGSAVDPYGNTRVGFDGSTEVNRKDWGLNWNAPLEAGGVLVGEKVVLEVELSAIKDAD